MKAERPFEAWVSDITYLKTAEGTIYLNMVTDAFSRRIVGYAVADSMGTAAMIKAFEMALAHRGHPDKPTIHHSDRVCNTAARANDMVWYCQ